MEYRELGRTNWKVSTISFGFRRRGRSRVREIYERMVRPHALHYW